MVICRSFGHFLGSIPSSVGKPHRASLCLLNDSRQRLQVQARSSTPRRLRSSVLIVSSQMLTRKRKIIVTGLITGSALLLFSSSPHIIDYVTNASMKAPYSPWASEVDSKGEEAFTLPDLSKNAAITETTLPGGSPAPGFTIFNRLYVWNGTIYAVTSNPRDFPQLRYILSKPKDQKGGSNLEPTSRVSPWMFVVSLS